MASKKTKKKGMSTGAMIGVGASVAALSAAAYVLFGPDAKKNRKAIKSWGVKMKGEIIEKMENVKEVTEPVYHDIINKVSAKYGALKSVDKKELEALVSDVRKHWKVMVKDGKAKKSSAKKSIKPKAKK